MNYLIYLSQANTIVDRTVIGDILKSSRKNNRALGVTGLLLYQDQTFLQILEGELTQLESLFETIKRDERHYCEQHPIMGQLDRRYFANWSMGFNEVGHMQSIPTLNDLVEHMDRVTTDKDHESRQLILNFMFSYSGWRKH